MHNSVLRILKRFRGSKLRLGIPAGLKSHNMVLFTSRNRAQIALLDEEKFHDVDATCTEVDTLSWLHKVAPAYPIDGSNITIIQDPSTFYTVLLEKCKFAKQRITFASLYLGTGKLESDLVKVIKETIDLNKGDIKVTFLLDHMRGSRGKVNSRKMLQPLLAGKHGDCCHVFLYHTPKLRGLLKAVIPDRFNELIGLQHMKLYMIDNTLIISGANLSNDYFTNRQDRYFVIEDCKDLCDFYDELVKRVGEFSFLLQPDGTTSLSCPINSHPFKGRKKEFVLQAASGIRTLFQNEIEKRAEVNKTTHPPEADTWIFPLVQMGQLNIRHDSEITLKLLQDATPGTVLKLATGYFNLTSEYKHAVLNCSRATCHLLTAHPTANGFFSAKGVAGGIPAAYTKIEESFYTMCEKMQQNQRVTLWEYVKPGWTYHAKGLWYFLPGQGKPCLTLIGSPNFGYRSVNRDLETQVAIVTKNDKLQTALYKEQERLFSHGDPVTRRTFSQENRIPPAWVSIAVVLFRYYF